ncbi:MAG: helix-turn-helix domain-containing protein [Actinobacteria bacterium]|nr:helix-turn-helix domain-containing protein [Actinomycetota bacterium]
MTHPEGHAEFARLMNESRLARHLSIRAVARIAGVPSATAQGWLSGRHLPAPALRESFLVLVAELGLASDLPQGLWEGCTADADGLAGGGAPSVRPRQDG